MRIISKKRDYYDVIAGSYYSADDILYVREEKIIELEYRTRDLYISLGSQDRGVHFSDGLIGFCGKLYPYIYISRNSVSTDGCYCYDTESVDHFLEKNYPGLVNEFATKTYRYYYQVSSLRSSNTIRDVLGYHLQWYSQQENKGKPQQLYKLFESITPVIPIFSVHRHGWDKVNIKTNCLLRPYEFYKVFDTQQTFQELQMFLSNIARPIKDIPKIDDVTMAQAKGFDKFSFRKQKKDKK